MNHYKVYTDLDSLMDTRYGVLSLMLKDHNLTFEDVFEKNYVKRIIDVFERKELGITKESYALAFKNRDIKTLVSSKPSNLLSNLLKLIVDMNDISGKTLDIAGVELTINVYPYKLTEEISDYLINEIKENIKYVETINLIEIKSEDLVASKLKDFTHVFSYHLFGSEEYVNFQNSFKDTFIPDVKIAVPAINAVENEITQYVDPENLKIIASILLAAHVTIVPVSTWTYDYKK